MLHPNPEYVEELKETINTSPFPDHMSMKVDSIELDRATATLHLGQCHLQPFGIVHGGVIATLIDTATFWSVFLRIPEDAGLVNIDLKLNYLKPARNGILRAEGCSVRSGNSISYAEARVYDPDDELVAHGTSTLMILPGKGLPASSAKFLAT